MNDWVTLFLPPSVSPRPQPDEKKRESPPISRINRYIHWYLPEKELARLGLTCYRLKDSLLDAFEHEREDYTRKSLFDYPKNWNYGLRLRLDPYTGCWLLPPATQTTIQHERDHYWFGLVTMDLCHCDPQRAREKWPDLAEDIKLYGRYIPVAWRASIGSWPRSRDMNNCVDSFCKFNLRHCMNPKHARLKPEDPTHVLSKRVTLPRWPAEKEDRFRELCCEVLAGKRKKSDAAEELRCDPSNFSRKFKRWKATHPAQPTITTTTHDCPVAHTTPWVQPEEVKLVPVNNDSEAQTPRGLSHSEWMKVRSYYHCELCDAKWLIDGGDNDNYHKADCELLDRSDTLA